MDKCILKFDKIEICKSSNEVNIKFSFILDIEKWILGILYMEKLVVEVDLM